MSLVKLVVNFVILVNLGSLMNLVILVNLAILLNLVIVAFMLYDNMKIEMII